MIGAVNMHVIFRDSPHSSNPIAAEGEIMIPEEEDIGDHMAELIPFTIYRDYSDFPLDRISNLGVLTKRGTSDWYDFKIIESHDPAEDGTRSGVVRILARF